MKWLDAALGERNSDDETVDEKPDATNELHPKFVETFKFKYTVDWSEHASCLKFDVCYLDPKSKNWVQHYCDTLQYVENSDPKLSNNSGVVSTTGYIKNTVDPIIAEELVLWYIKNHVKPSLSKKYLEFEKIDKEITL